MLATASSDSERVAVGHVPSAVEESQDLGPAEEDLPFSRIVLLLSPRDPAALETFLARQQDPTSPDFHCWLSPEEFGRRFGARSEDVDRVSAWLSEQNLTVLGPNAGRTVLLFSGRLGEVARAFQTEFRNLVWNGEPHIANVTAPTIPRALSGAVQGVLSLDDFRRARPLRRTRLATSPSGSHFLAPADFAALYGLEPLYASGLDGHGVTVAILGGSQVRLSDLTFFRQFFGLPAAPDPLVLVDGPDPGINNLEGWEGEGCLDLEWVGAVAPAANIVFVVSDQLLLGPTDADDLGALDVIDHDRADVLSISAGWCEHNSTPSFISYHRNLWAQAAAQGISVLIATGDTGILCEIGSAVSVNALGSSPYSTNVGGTEFDDGPDPSSYWNATNDPITQRSVKGPIPEIAWSRSGGGLSDVYPRPAWQEVPGLSPGTKRAIPDVSLNASPHTGYLTAFHGGVFGFGGTSASTPAFAGIVALLNQKLGGRQGNLNPTLYALGRAQYGGGGPAVFHDATSGNNSYRGIPGYSAGPGYDLVTGLGSVDAAALLSAWAFYVQGIGTPVVDLSLGASPAAFSIAPGGNTTVLVTLSATNGAEAIASLDVSGLPQGWKATFAPSKQTDSSSGFVSPGVASILALAAPADAAIGTYPLVLTASAGGLTRRVTLLSSVGPASTTSPGVELQVPVVLDVFGSGGSHFTSDFFAMNRSPVDRTLLLRYVASPGTAGAGAPILGRSLPAGKQFYVSDMIAFLAANGVTLPSDGSAKLGTLFATFAGVEDSNLVAAGSRSSTPNPNVLVGGNFGTFSPAIASGSAASGDTWIYGLREDGSFRSNLAIVHSPLVSSFGASAPVTVEVQLFDGDLGTAAGAPLTYTLQPSEFHQFNRVLAERGLSNGYARVRRTSGSDRVITYGVVNDGAASGGGTSDGSLLPAGAADGLVPIVLDLQSATHFQTELTLANQSLTSAASVTLTYRPAAILGATGGGTVTAALAPGRQLQVPNAISFLRSRGLAIPNDGSPQGGALLVNGAAVLARTFNSNPDATVGGTFGLAYPAVAPSERAKIGAWVYGLRQDAFTRSNLAIADARASGLSLDYLIEVYDAASGSLLPVQTLSRTLAPGQWVQIDLVLRGAGILQGYVHVFPASGASDFVVYGVVNDGATPGSRTSDGSYLSMVAEN